MGLTKPRAAQIFNLDYKQSTRVVTTTNITLTGGAPSLVDGVTLSLGDRVLVTAQTTGSQNGLYYVTTLGSGANGTWARTSDGNENGEIEAGMIVMVTEGVIYADTQWKLITDDPIIINTTALTFTQNYMANSISSGTSNVVVNSNANVTISTAGTANVLTISSTGTVTAGTASVTGNVTGGNVLTGGAVSATGNITGNYILGNGASLTGVITSVANINNGTSNVTVVSSGGDVTVGVGGTGNVAVFATTGEYVTGVVSASGNITGGNILTAGLISATGNVNGGNLGTAGTALISGAMSVSGSTVLYSSGTNNDTIGPNKTTGLITIGSSGGTGTITLGQSTANQTVNIATGILPGGITKAINIGTGGTSTSQTNITIGTLTAPTTTTFQSATTVAIANTGASALSVAGTVTAASVVGGVITGSSTSVTGTTTAASVVGGVITGSSVSVTGNVTGANIVATTALTNGNITITGPNIVADGSTITIDPNGSGGSDGAVIIAGNLSVTGNVTYINSNNITTNDLTINVANNAATAAAANGGGIGVGPAGSEYISLTYNATSNVWVASNGLNVQGVSSATGNVTGGNVLTGGLVSATANITGGNIRTVGQVSATGNVSTDTFFVGNGYFLTGLTSAVSVTKIENGNSNVWVNTPGGDVTVTAGGVSNVVVFSTGSMTLQGAFGTPKTITANIIVAGNINAMLIGPVVFGNGYNLTVPDSSTVYVYAP